MPGREGSGSVKDRTDRRPSHVGAGSPLPHKHTLRKFHCLEESDEPFPRQLLVCFGCRRVFTEERKLVDAGVRLG